MAIDNQYDGEVVGGATNFKRGDDHVKNTSFRQAKSPPGCSLPRHTEQSTEESTEKSTCQLLLTSQMPTGRKSTKIRIEKSTEKTTGKV